VSRRISLILALLVVLATGGCSSCNIVVYRVAVGWSGSLPSWSGPCDTSTLRPIGFLRELAPGTFAAPQPGDAEVRCRDGIVRVQVRAPTRLTIDGVAAMLPGRTSVLGATVAGADGDLVVGEDALAWTVSAPLRAYDRCVDGLCVPATSLRVVAIGPGEAVVTVRLGNLEATRKVVVTSE
jgi:hypothetical protein